MLVTIEILGATQEELKALGKKLPSSGKLGMRPMKDSLLFWKWKGFQISGVNEGLDDNASVKSENWALTPETKQSLKDLLAAFTKICPRRFYLYAAESGDLPRRETEVNHEEILELIAEGHLGNRVKYLARPVTQSDFGTASTPEVALRQEEQP
jgi:hypothetical protein